MFINYAFVFVYILVINAKSLPDNNNTAVLISKYAKVAHWGSFSTTTNTTNKPSASQGRSNNGQTLWTHRSDVNIRRDQNVKATKPTLVVYQYPVQIKPSRKIDKDTLPAIGEVQERFNPRPYFSYESVPPSNPQKIKSSQPSTFDSFPVFSKPSSKPILSSSDSDSYASSFNSYNPPPPDAVAVKDNPSPNIPSYPPNGPIPSDTVLSSPPGPQSDNSFPQGPSDSSDDIKPYLSNKPDIMETLPSNPSSEDNHHYYPTPPDSEHNPEIHHHSPEKPPKDEHLYYPPSPMKEEEEHLYYPPSDDGSNHEVILDHPPPGYEEHKQNNPPPPPQPPQLDMAEHDLAPPPGPAVDYNPHFPQYLYNDPHSQDIAPDAYNFDHHHHHHPVEIYHEVMTTTKAPEDERVNKGHYSYYYLGRKLWYIPLYFSVYFVIYVAVLILKSISRHKIEFKNHFDDYRKSRMINVDEIDRNVTEAIDTATRKFTYIAM